MARRPLGTLATATGTCTVWVVLAAPICTLTATSLTLDRSPRGSLIAACWRKVPPVRLDTHTGDVDIEDRLRSKPGEPYNVASTGVTVAPMTPKPACGSP